MKEAPQSYDGYRQHINLVQSDKELIQKHQELYKSPDKKPCKAKKLQSAKESEPLHMGRCNL